MRVGCVCVCVCVCINYVDIASHESFTMRK